MSWKPVLEGKDADAANHAIDAVAAQLEAELVKSSEASLGGHAGGAIFFEWLARAREEDKFRETVEKLLNQATDWVGERTMGPGLYSGFTGVAWALELLSEPSAGEDPNEEIDPVLLEYIRRSNDDNYDVISGYAGMAVYFGRRTARGTGREGLEAVVKRLEDLAERTTEGITWKVSDTFRRRAVYEVLEYNLGVAHGIPGVIAALAEIVGKTKSERAAALLDPAVQFLLTFKNPDGEGSVFPSQANRGPRPPPGAARPTWCYGDLGVAVALLSAARRRPNPAWESVALETAAKSARIPVESSNVVDTGLCHGSAGTGHLFNRFFNATGNDLFRVAAAKHFRRLLDRRGSGGIGGFKSLGVDGKQWVDDPGLLTGAVGIGLALLAAVSPISPEWDEILLASLPAGT